MPKYKKRAVVKLPAIATDDRFENMGIKEGDRYIAFLEVKYNPIPKEK